MSEKTQKSSTFFKMLKSGSVCVEPAVIQLNQSWLLHSPCPRTVYRKLPICVVIFNSLLLSESTDTWWKPDIASKQAKKRADGSMWRSSWPEDSPPQIGRSRAVFKSQKSVTQRHLIGQLFGFLLGNAWELHSLASPSDSTTMPAFLISVNSAWAALRKWIGIS